MTVYKPIFRPFYQRIEAFHSSQSLVEIEYLNTDGNKLNTIAKVNDLYSTTDGEFINLDSGQTLRLDQLVSVTKTGNQKADCGIDRDGNPCGDASDY